MDLKGFVPALAKYTGIQNQELLEKDVRLHLLLTALAGDDRLHEHLLFKRGNCLIKCFLGYWRFSEDLDFTWRAGQFAKKSSTPLSFQEQALQNATRVLPLCPADSSALL